MFEPKATKDATLGGEVTSMPFPIDEAHAGTASDAETGKEDYIPGTQGYFAYIYHMKIIVLSPDYNQSLMLSPF